MTNHHPTEEFTMSEIIGSYGGFRRTLLFGFACLIYHATEVFCERDYSYKNDAQGKTVGQMVGAARSARQNIVEGSSRAGTSKETVLRLYDVAKASLEELAGDYETFLIGHNEVPWEENSSQATVINSLVLEQYQGHNSRHEYGEYILSMRKRFAKYLEAEDQCFAANSILIVSDRACCLLHRQMERIAKDFCVEGGFSERMSKARIEYRDAFGGTQDTPICPKCGKPMRKMLARRGRNAGSSFWSCSGYPECNYTRNC